MPIGDNPGPAPPPPEREIDEETYKREESIRTGDQYREVGGAPVGTTASPYSGDAGVLVEPVAPDPRPTPPATPTPKQQEAGQPAERPAVGQPTYTGSVFGYGNVYIPVVGMTADQIDNNYGYEREGGERRHKGIDLGFGLPAGTEVVAPVGGRIRYAERRSEDGGGSGEGR